MINVFVGNQVDYRLFGFLLNSLGMSFEDTRNAFPELIGSYTMIDFADLQAKLKAAYPDGPPQDQSLDRFFKEQLYDELNIDFGSIVQAVTTYSAGSDQEIISRSVEAKIKDFLEDLYCAK